MTVKRNITAPLGLRGSYSNIVPFTIRETPSLTYVVETMRRWLESDLVPHINDNVNTLVDDWEYHVKDLSEEWRNLSNDLQDYVQDLSTEMHDRLGLAQIAQSEAERARDQAAIFASQAQEVQDQAIHTIFIDESSQFRNEFNSVIGQLIREDVNDPGTFIIG